MPDYTPTLARLSAAATADLAELRAARTAYIEATNEEGDAAVAHKLLQEAAAAVQQNAHARIAVLTDRCLAAIFDEPYEFNIEFQQKRGRTEARLVFRRDGYEIDPLNASGGGVVDVCSFALRLAALLASRPPRRRLLIMDEPFKHLSREYRPRVRALLEGLAGELGVQFILVTHDPALQIGRVIEIGEPQ